MPTLVQVEGVGEIEFDSSMDEAAILRAIETQILPRYAPQLIRPAPQAESVPAEPEAEVPQGNRFMRALRRGYATGQAANALGYGIDATGIDLERLAGLQKQAQALPASPELQQFQKTPFRSLAGDPLGIPLELTAESLGAMAPVALRKVPAAIVAGVGMGAVAGAPVAGIGAVPGAAIGLRGGFTAGMGLTSTQLEYAAKFMETLQELGFDTSNPEELKRAFSDPETVAKAKNLGLRKGIPIGLVDTLSAGLAGRFLGKPGQTIAAALAKAGKEAGVQALLGGAGEALGETVAGEELSPASILAEMIAEPVTSVPEVAMGVAGRVIQARAERRAAQAGGTAETQPVQPEPPAPPAFAPPAEAAPPAPEARTVGVRRKAPRSGPNENAVRSAAYKVLKARGVSDDVAVSFVNLWMQSATPGSLEEVRSQIGTAFDEAGFLDRNANTYSGEANLREAAEANQFSEADIQDGVLKRATRQAEIDAHNRNLIQQSFERTEEPPQIGSAAPAPPLAATPPALPATVGVRRRKKPQAPAAAETPAPAPVAAALQSGVRGQESGVSQIGTTPTTPAAPASTPKSSTQLTLPAPEAAPFVQFAKSIPDAAVYHKPDATGKEDFGIEQEPHITVLYGLTEHTPEPVRKAVSAHGPITVTLGKLSVFEQDDYDVLKVDVTGDDRALRALNAEIKKLPNEQTFPDYKPHMTIAYLKKGQGKRYVDDVIEATRFLGKKLTFNSLTFSPPSEVLKQVGVQEIPFTAPPAGTETGKAAEPVTAPAPQGVQPVPPSRLGAKQSDVSAADVLRRVVDSGETFTLANGWKIFRSRVLGEQRIEVSGVEFSGQREWTDFIGGYVERIDWKPRFFIATDATAAVPALEKVLAKSPIVPKDDGPKFSLNPNPRDESYWQPYGVSRDEQDASLVRQLGEWIARRFESTNYQRGAVAPARQERRFPLSTQSERSGIEAVERLFGKRVVEFEDRVNGPIVGGAAIPGLEAVIFVNREQTVRTPLIVVGHELLHQLRRQRPDLYEQLLADLSALIKDYPAFEKESAWLGYTDQEVKEELLANFTGDQMAEPAFWDKLAARNPTLFGKIGQSIKTWLNDILDWLSGHGYQSSRFFSDISKAQDALANALSEYAANPTSPDTGAHFAEGWTEVEGATPERDSTYDQMLGGPGTTANAILDALSENAANTFEFSLAKRLQELGLTTKVRLAPQAEALRRGHALANGVYLPDTNEILLFESATNQKKTLLHELVHATTVQSLEQNNEYRGQIQELLNTARAHLGSYHLGETYGLKNVQEFVAEAFTNPAFQQKLRDIPVPGANLWQKFVQFVRRVLGLQPSFESLLEQTLKLSAAQLKAGQAKSSEPLFSLTPEQRVQQDISSLDPDLQKEIAEVLAKAGTDELVKTKVFNAFDTVIDREQMTEEVVRNGVVYARNFFGNLGLQVEQDQNGFWKLSDETLDSEIEGRQMVEALTKELAQKEIDAPSKGYLANLLNSVVVNMTPDRVSAFSQDTRNQLYSLAQGERSHRGLLLGMLSHGSRTVEYVARNVSAVLQRVYQDAFAGDTVRKFVDAIRKSFGGYFTGEVVQGVLEANPELQQAIDRINAERNAEKLIPSVAELVRQILNTPLYRQSEIRERFSALLQKTYEVDQAQAERAAELLDRVFSARYATARRAALEKALAALEPHERKALRKKPAVWKKIEQAVNAGVFETGALLNRIGQAHGWMPLTPEIAAKMRAWAERMQRLRELTPEEITEIESFSSEPKVVALEKQRAISEREAFTRQERLQIKKQIEVMWSRLSHPLNFKGNAENVVNAAYEWASAVLLLKFGFPTRQIIDVATQGFLHAPTRAIAAAWDRIELNRQEGKPLDAAKELSSAIGSGLKTYLKALRPAAAKARSVLGGASTGRNVENLVSQIALFERIAQQADEATARGEHTKALLLRLVTWVRAARTFASALDQLQGTSAEYQEVRQQVVTGLRERGKSPAEAEMAADQIVRDPLTEWQLAITHAQAMSDKLGLDYSTTQVRSAAEDLALARAYQRMREAGLPADDFMARNAEFRETIGWNVKEEGGLGGWVGAAFKATSELGAKANIKGIPVAAPFSIAFGRFGNAISIAANRGVTLIGGGFAPGLFGVTEKNIDPKTGIAIGGSPWFRTASDRRQRKVEAAIGTMLGMAAIALVATGVASVRWKPPDDKEERELWFKMHKPYTVEFNLPNGDFYAWSLTTGPFRVVAPYLVGAGAVLERLEQAEKRQTALNEAAAKQGLAPGKARGLDVWDYGYIAGQAALSTILGGRTATGLVGAVTDYGIPNINKSLAHVVSSVLPPLPAMQEIARAAGIFLDPKLASFFDYLIPLPTSQGRSTNFLGERVSTEDDFRRIIQVATGGTFPFPVSPSALAAQPAYQSLLASGYRPPSINPNRGYNVRGEFRPFSDDELGRYTQLRGDYFKQALSSLGPGADRDAAASAYQQANERALSEMGVAIESSPAAATSASVAAPRASASMGTSAAAGARPRASGMVGLRRRGGYGVRLPGRVGVDNPHRFKPPLGGGGGTARARASAAGRTRGVRRGRRRIGRSVLGRRLRRSRMTGPRSMRLRGLRRR